MQKLNKNALIKSYLNALGITLSSYQVFLMYSVNEENYEELRIKYLIFY